MDVTGTTIAKTVADLVKSDDVLKESSKIFGMLFPFAGIKKKAVDMYINEIEKSDLPIDTKLLFVLDIKKKIKELKNQENIVDIAMNNAEKGTDFSEKSGVSEEWLDRFMDSARFVCAEDVQLIWGKILANEFERPNSTPPNMIRILSEITPELAKAFSLICKMEIWIVLLEYDGHIKMADKKIFIPFVNNIDEFYGIGINYDTLSELETLGLIRFKSNTGFVIQGLEDENVLICLGDRVDIIENSINNEIPFGDVMLTSAGRVLRTIMNYNGEEENFDNYYEMVKKYMVFRGVGFAKEHDFLVETNEDRIAIRRQGSEDVYYFDV